MNKHNYFTQLRCINYTNIDLEGINEQIEESNRQSKKYGISDVIQNSFDNRIYKDIHLNNDKNSKNTFEYIDQFVNNVVQTKDTINGLKIHFEKGSTYNEFIEVLNIFYERDAELYILDHNTMYFVGRDWKPIKEDDPKIIPLECWTIWANDNIVNEEKTNFKSFINSLKAQFNQNKIIYSGYLVFVIVTILSIFLKNKKLPK